MDTDLYPLATALGDHLRARALKLVTAESCTGGWIAKTVTDVAGSSAWFERGFITYSNLAKMEMLGVRVETLQTHGAVSEATVRAMATGALRHSQGDVAVAVTGIAGPDGGTVDKPVGTVWFAWASRHGDTHTQHRLFDGEREAVRCQAVTVALQGILDLE